MVHGRRNSGVPHRLSMTVADMPIQLCFSDLLQLLRMLFDPFDHLTAGGLSTQIFQGSLNDQFGAPALDGAKMLSRGAGFFMFLDGLHQILQLSPLMTCHRFNDVGSLAGFGFEPVDARFHSLQSNLQDLPSNTRLPNALEAIHDNLAQSRLLFFLQFFLAIVVHQLLARNTQSPSRCSEVLYCCQECVTKGVDISSTSLRNTFKLVDLLLDLCYDHDVLACFSNFLSSLFQIDDFRFPTVLLHILLEAVIIELCANEPSIHGQNPRILFQMLSPQDEIPQQLSITAVSSFFDEQGHHVFLHMPAFRLFFFHLFLDN
mmetsp:Transcript_50139/g.102100  ORF Transcript_50139/g.102100 Transcript_50139/m.102100 type:complete len:317 (+) Transcript_50139:446-1396(+)